MSGQQRLGIEKGVLLLSSEGFKTRCCEHHVLLLGRCVGQWRGGDAACADLERGWVGQGLQEHGRCGASRCPCVMVHPSSHLTQ